MLAVPYVFPTQYAVFLYAGFTIFLFLPHPSKTDLISEKGFQFYLASLELAEELASPYDS